MRGEGRLAPPPCRCPFHHGGEGTWCLSWPLCFPTAAAGLHKALGFNLIYQLLPDDLIYPALCQSLPKSLTCAQSRPTFPTTDLMSHTCPRPSLSEDNSTSSPNLTIHPPPQPGPGLMNSHNHTLIQSHTHTHTHTIKSSSSRKEQIQRLPLPDTPVPSAVVGGRGPQPVWTLSPQASKSGSYRPKEPVLLGPGFFYAGRFTSVIKEDLCKSSLPFMAKGHALDVPCTSNIIMALKVHQVLQALSGIQEHVSAQGSLNSSPSLSQSLLGPVGPSTLFNTHWPGGFDVEFLPRPHSQLPSLFPPRPRWWSHIKKSWVTDVQLL